MPVTFYTLRIFFWSNHRAASSDSRATVRRHGRRLSAIARFVRMARLLAKDSDLALPEILLTPGCNRLGREGENDFLVPHPSVSRQHCEVWLTEDALLVRDLNSRNGTFVDEARVQEAAILTGQTLRL